MRKTTNVLITKIMNYWGERVVKHGNKDLQDPDMKALETILEEQAEDELLEESLGFDEWEDYWDDDTLPCGCCACCGCTCDYYESEDEDE